jgi:hypothetical protein
VDGSIFPDYEDSGADHVGALIMPNRIPTPAWLLSTHFVGERSRRLLFGEMAYDGIDPIVDMYRNSPPQPSPTDHVHTERTLKVYWTAIESLVADVFTGEITGNLNVHVNGNTFDMLLDRIIAMRKAEERLRMPSSTTLDPEDEPTMFHENMLMACYGKLEVCRAVVRLIELIREKVLKTDKAKKKHPLRTWVPENYDTKLRKETETCYHAVRDVAHGYVKLLRTRGVTAIKAQVRWGSTGRRLKRFLSDDDVEFYANEYVDSALEGWKGVLKVKLEK